MRKHYISPHIKAKEFSLERTGIMTEASIPKGSSDGPVIDDGSEIEAKKYNFNVWDEE